MSRQQTSAILLLVLALQILPVSDAVAKSMSASLPLLQVVWARFFFHCFATGAYAAWRYGPETLRPTVSTRLLARSASLFVAVGLFYVAIHFMPLTAALTLWFVAPFLLTLMARFLFKRWTRPSGLPSRRASPASSLRSGRRPRHGNGPISSACWQASAMRSE